MKFFYLISLFSISWLVAANFDFVDTDTAIPYQLQFLTNPTDGFPSELTIGGNSKYRIVNQIVIYQTRDFPPKKYTHCSVMDASNWECEYDDKSGVFGFKGGLFYEKSSSYKSPWVLRGVSRFDYVMNIVAWHFASKSWLEKAFVLFIPFFV